MNPLYKSAFALLVCFIVISGKADGQEFSNRLTGKPMAKASCDINGCIYEKLSETDQAKYELALTQANESYFWTSREGKSLNHYVSGIFDVYVRPDSSDYIKTTHQENQCIYMEHLTLAFQTVTYWGICEES